MSRGKYRCSCLKLRAALYIILVFLAPLVADSKMLEIMSMRLRRRLFSSISVRLMMISPPSSILVLGQKNINWLFQIKIGQKQIC